jgi:hypothetical protein
VLEGARLYLAIGDPWDFRSEAGEGALVVQVRQSPNEKIAYGDCSPFNYADRKVTSVAVICRYVGEKIATNSGVNILFSRFKDPILDLADTTELSWLIGSIKRIEPKSVA